jgi:RNA recognition motif-containing protein
VSYNELKMNLFVKNIPESINAYYLELMFAPFGEVVSAKVLYDRASGEHKGSGFVEMATEEQGNAAIAGVNGKEIRGQVLSVEKARPAKNNIWR